MDSLSALELTINLKAPVLISGSVGDENMVASEDYIAGSALLGAFAAAYLTKNKIKNLNQERNEFIKFSDLFISNKVSFLNGYPVTENGKRMLPMPLSIKYEKGMNQDAKDEFFDTQLTNYKHKTGYCYIEPDTTNNHGLVFERLSVGKQYQFHHQRTNQSVGRSATGEIFNYESILGNQIFKSLIVGPSYLLNELKHLVDTYGKIIRLGRSRNTQYGKAEITIGGMQDYNGEVAYMHNKDNDPHILTITLTSDIILLNDNGHAETNIRLFLMTLGFKEELINSLLHQKNQDIEKIKSYFRTKIVESYNAAWKARTPSHTAFIKGSCFKFILTKDEYEQLRIPIESILKNGIGLRRNEGYGRFVVNWQCGPITDKAVNVQISKPKTAPMTVQDIFKRLIKAQLIERTKAKAAYFVNKFCDKSENKSQPTSTQLHKLRRFARDSGNYMFFHDKLEQMPKSAKDRLKSIKYSEGSIWEFLNSDPTAWLNFVDAKDFMLERKENTEDANHTERDNLQEFLDAADLHEMLNDQALHNEIFLVFYDNFFTLYDKKLKTNSAEAQEGNND